MKDYEWKFESHFNGANMGLRVDSTFIDAKKIYRIERTRKLKNGEWSENSRITFSNDINGKEYKTIEECFG